MAEHFSSSDSAHLNSEVSVLYRAANQLGEGPHWSTTEDRLYWVDIVAGSVCSVDAQGAGYRCMYLHEPVGAVIPCRAGGVLAALQSGIYRVDATGARVLLAHPENDRPGNRFNDGKCDSLGRFWVGSLSTSGEINAGRLWRVDPDGQCHLVEQNLCISNGLGWSPDNQSFYHTDSGRNTIYVYDIDMPTGELSRKRVFANCPADQGVPDGLTVDAQGYVWSAQWDGSCIIRYDPLGNIERRINLPVPRPTSCTFGGADCRTLYVTSARTGLDADTLALAPDSGNVFNADVNILGIPDKLFG